MAPKSNTAPTTSTLKAAKAKAAKEAREARKLQAEAREALVAEMKAVHASRKPDGEGSRHGRHSKPRMPNKESMRKFGNTVLAAIEAGSMKGDALKVERSHATWSAFAKTWLGNQHGWRQDQTCARCAIFLGFEWRRNMATVSSNMEREAFVMLRPVDPKAFAKDPAGYVAAHANQCGVTLGGAQ